MSELSVKLFSSYHLEMNPAEEKNKKKFNKAFDKTINAFLGNALIKKKIIIKFSAF